MRAGIRIGAALALGPSLTAIAAPVVKAQKGCAIAVHGTTELPKGSPVILIRPNGESLKGKIGTFKQGRLGVLLENQGGTCPALLEEKVQVLLDESIPAAPIAPTGPAPLGMPRMTLQMTLGGLGFTFSKPEGARPPFQSGLSYGGLETSASVLYSFPMRESFSVPAELGLVWFSATRTFTATNATTTVNSQRFASYEQTLKTLCVRVGGGGRFDWDEKVRLQARLFADWAATGGLSRVGSMNSQAAAGPFFRGGVLLEGDYKLWWDLRAGASLAAWGGSLKLASALDAHGAGPFSLAGASGALLLARDF